MLRKRNFAGVNRLSFISFLLLTFFMSKPAFCQLADSTSKKPIKIVVGAGYLAGGQIYNDTFLYNPGFKFDASAYFNISEAILLGAGTGFVSLTKKERFIPIYASFKGFIKPSKSGTFLLAKAGYSLGWDNDIALIPGYEFQGGFMVNAGLGHRFLMNKTALMLALVYVHQEAGAKFVTPEGKLFKERLDFDWLGIELQFMF